MRSLLILLGCVPKVGSAGVVTETASMNNLFVLIGSVTTLLVFGVDGCCTPSDCSGTDPGLT